MKENQNRRWIDVGTNATQRGSVEATVLTRAGAASLATTVFFFFYTLTKSIDLDGSRAPVVLMADTISPSDMKLSCGTWNLFWGGVNTFFRRKTTVASNLRFVDPLGSALHGRGRGSRAEQISG